MENDEQNNNIDTQNYNSQIDEEKLEEQKRKEATKKGGKIAGEVIGDVFTGGAVTKAKSIPIAGSLVDKGLDVAGSAIGKAAKVANPNIDKSLQKADEAGILDAAQNITNIAGGSISKNPNMSKASKPATESFSKERMPITPNQNLNKDSDVKDLSEELPKNEVEELKNEVENQNLPTDEKPKEVSGDFSFNIVKKVLAIIGIGILLFIIIYFIYISVSRMDLVGKKYTDYDELDYVANTSLYCDNITLIKETDSYTGTTVSNIDDVNLSETVTVNNQTINRWESTSYKLEDYVKGVLQAETVNVNDEKTFEVASIVARTYALQIASQNCRIWSNANKNGAYRNPQNFTTDTPNEKISSSVSTTAGVVLIDNDNLLDLSKNNYYDYMCFEKLEEDDNNNKNYEIIQDVIDGRLLPTEWVLENVNTNDYNKSGKYDGQCQKDGLSLYSAKYLMNTKSDKYSPIRVLKYFYGYSIDLKKVSKPFTFDCGGFNLHGTSLTKEQFINLVNSYNGGAKYKNLAAIAGEIYDLSVSNNFNPELVITRAIREGFSGGTNNYWGIAAYNGKSGKNFSSLTEGVLAYINTMNKYSNANTLYDVFNDYHYAFIGAKWFSPGGSGLGGCYYLPYIEQYYTNPSRLAEAKASCASGSQIATNDEDQSAYSMWQVSKMNDSRSDVFGISDENCDEAENPLAGNMNAQEILNSDASIGQKAAQLAIAMFDNFGYSQDKDERMSTKVDCSSLVYRTYQQLGINTGTNTEEIYNRAVAQNRFITKDQLQPGDLVWRKGHVEIYIGNGQTFGAHTANTSFDRQVRIDNMGNFTHYIRPY